MNRKKIKICGISSIKTVPVLNRVLPDFIGFVFAPSRRMVDVKTAAAIRKALNPSISSVGVFVNESASEIIPLAENGVIDLIQLCGDETEEYISRLKQSVKAPVIKVIKVKENGEITGNYNTLADYILLDTYSEKMRGGTGKSFDFLNTKIDTDKKIFLAGGINLSNIESAKISPFYAIDISGGAEENGEKSDKLISEIINIIRR